MIKPHIIKRYEESIKQGQDFRNFIKDIPVADVWELLEYVRKQIYMIKHDEKKMEEIMAENFFNGTGSDGAVVMKQYAEHMVQQEKNRIQQAGEKILDDEMEYYGTDKHGLSREQFINLINKEDE